MRFFCVDVETANADRSSICAIGLVEFADGVAVREWYSLIDPKQHFDMVNVSIHGIEAKDVRGAPMFADVLPDLAQWLNGEVVFSHMPFDRTAFAAACQRGGHPELFCTWADSAKIARRTWDQCRSSGYGLKDVCEIIEFSFRHHNALEDAIASGMVVLAAAKVTGLDLSGLLALQSLKLNAERPWERDAGVAAQLRNRPEPVTPATGHPVVVFTGEMRYERSEIGEMAVRNGWVVHDRVTKKTTHLVVGDDDLSNGVATGKRKKALEYAAKGQDIKIMAESAFLDDELGWGDPGMSEKPEKGVIEVWRIEGRSVAIRFERT